MGASSFTRRTSTSATTATLLVVALALLLQTVAPAAAQNASVATDADMGDKGMEMEMEMDPESMDPIDDAEEMLEDFNRFLLRRGVIDMFDEDTGKKLPNSKAIEVSVNPDDPNDLEVGIFIDDKDLDSMGEDSTPGSDVSITLCDFKYPAECEKKEPYKGAPEDYECGKSDESNAKTGFACMVKTTKVNDAGDIALIDDFDTDETDNDDEDMEDKDAEDDNDDDDDDKDGRRHLLQRTRGRNRSGRGSRSIRGRGAVGYSAGRTRRRRPASRPGLGR